MKTRLNGLLRTIPAITSIGTTKMATCVPEPAAIPIDKSSLPLLASIIALLCSAAFPTIPTIIAPTNISPNPNFLIVTSTELTNTSLTKTTPITPAPSNKIDFFLLQCES